MECGTRNGEGGKRENVECGTRNGEGGKGLGNRYESQLVIASEAKQSLREALSPGIASAKTPRNDRLCKLIR